jgi:hypothetical protein
MDNEQKTTKSPVAAGLAGFVIGVVGTTAVVMSDKDTRTKVTQKANALKDKMEKWSRDTMHDFQASSGEAKKREIKTSSTSAADEAKQRLEDALSESKKEL